MQASVIPAHHYRGIPWVAELRELMQQQKDCLRQRGAMRKDTWMLSSDPHMCAVMCVCVCACTHIHKQIWTFTHSHRDTYKEVTD